MHKFVIRTLILHTVCTVSLISQLIMSAPWNQSLQSSHCIIRPELGFLQEQYKVSFESHAVLAMFFERNSRIWANSSATIFRYVWF